MQDARVSAKRGTMHIELRVPGQVRRGHVALARRLEQLPATVALVPVPIAQDSRAFALMRLEGMIGGPVAEAHLPATWRSSSSLPAAIEIDLTDVPRGGWRPCFDGRPGEGALLEALQGGRFPLVSILDAEGEKIVSGRPGSEQPGVLAAAYSDVLAGLATLLLSALRGTPVAAPAPGEHVADPSVRRTAPSLPVVAARKTAGLMARHAYRALYRSPHWRVGWRFVEQGQPDVLDLLDHPREGWHDLPDDGHHFYADPFPVVHDGDTWLFVEDFDHRLGRGVISAVGFDEDGPVGVPRTVLEHDVHLSYPHVLEHDGEMWMVPETSGAGRIELYRARSFPDRWSRERVLVQDVVASDATVFLRDSTWWMLATVRHGGSFSDTLQAWTADQLWGPWTPHRTAPLVVDIASARPAGRVVIRDGRVLRPVQDNRNGYGASLLLTEITRLDADGFDQRVIGSLGASPESWPGRRLHTLNRAGRLEVIDGSATSFRLRPHTPGAP